MTQVSDITNTVSSGLTHIDALLAEGPQWNYLTASTNNISYTFSIDSNNESGVTNQKAFSNAQKNATVGALNYISNLTGINFSETSNGNEANIHFSFIDIPGDSTAGLSSWSLNYSFDSNNTVIDYSINAYVYLDNVEWLFDNNDLTPNGNGYEVLLHEIGHTLGLKHPFEGDPTLPDNQDNTANTLMSYTSSGGPYSTYSPFDVAALNWIYGADGLGGDLGINSNNDGRYWTGTADADLITAGNSNDLLKGEAGKDTLTGGAGNDLIDGGLEIDTAIYNGIHAQYIINSANSSFSIIDTSNNDIDALINIERLQFSDKSVALDMDGHAGSTAKILGVIFGKEAISNMSYAGIGLKLLDEGMSDQDLLQLALTVKLGPDPTNADVVNLLYQNLVDSLPSSSDLNFWTETITSGQHSQASLGILAANLDLNATNINLVGLANSGLEYL